MNSIVEDILMHYGIDEIIRYDFQNIYRKVTSKSETNEHKEKAS